MSSGWLSSIFMDDPKQKQMFNLIEAYKKEKEKVLEDLRSLGVPEKMLRSKTLDELNALLDRMGGY